MRTKLYFNWLERGRWFKGRRLVCEYCGVAVSLDKNAQRLKATIDHRVPVSRGGSFKDESNLAVACMACNQEKGQLTDAEWRLVLEERWRQLALPGLEDARDRSSMVSY